MKFEIKKKILKPLCIYTLAFSMLLPSVASLADLDINLGGYSVVYAAGIEAPTITKAFIGTNTISGGKLHRGRINGKNARGTVHVTLKDSSGNEKDTVSVTPKSGTTWTVKLSDGVTIAEGDTVTAYQEFDGSNSEPVTVNAMDSLAIQNKDKLKMPTGEIWIEQTSSNQVNADEQAEAVQMFNNANTAIAGDIKSVEFSIDGTSHAYYEVTYTDGSTSGKVEATNLQINQVTEYSRGATLGSITIVDNVIKGQLAGEGPFDGIKVQILLKLSDAVKDSYCDGGKCLVDKDTSNPVDATVDGTTGEFSYTIPNPDLKLDQKVGVTVKEPHKFKSCSQTTVKPVVVGKTEVKDPRKLTKDDKRAIDAAIRTAYTVGGVSKLPNGTGQWDGVPAVIQIDDSGNVKIFGGNDVAGTWDPNNGYKFVPEKNGDGSYKLKDGAQPKITIAAEDLLKNLKPDAPEIKVNESDKTKININAQAVDTDANVITVSYTGSDDSNKTLKATKADDGTWSITEGEGSVDANGVVTLEISKVKGGTNVTATVTDKGGIADDDKEALTSDQAEFKVTKAILVEALGGLDPEDIKKWVGDEVDWKDGIKASDSASDENKAKIKEILNEAGTKFTDETTPGRNTDAQGDYTGTIKVAFDDGSFIEVENQNLYVSDPVNPSDKENLPKDAIDVELKLGEGVKAGDKEGNKETPVTAKTYKVKPGTDLSTEKVSGTDKTSFEDVGATVTDDTYVDITWNDKDKGTNFKATAENNVFTATATKTFKVTLDPNSGSGSMDGATVKENGTYKLPTNTFTAPENMQFSGWQVGVDTTLKQAGDEITITGNTVVKAIWKPIELKVNFLPGTGASGEMKDVPVNKGSDYELPEPTFTAPENQEFAGWKVGNEDGVKKAGETIKITDNVTLTATWKKIQAKVSYNENGGSGDMTGAVVDKGSDYTVLPNGFTAPDDTQEFDTWEVNGQRVAPGTAIKIDDNTVIKALWKKIKATVSYDANGGKGTMDGKTVDKGSDYTVLPNTFTAPDDTQEFDTWEVNGQRVAPGTAIKIDDNTVIKALWKKIKATVSYDANGGKGTMDGKTVDKGSDYTVLPNTFTAPDDTQEFDTWEVNGQRVAPGTAIKVDDNTVIKALWKKIKATVSYDANGGKGTMDGKTVDKGSDYTVLPNGFTAPDDTQEFDTWEVNGQRVAPGTAIKIDDNTVVKALWKNKPVNEEYKVSFESGEGASGIMNDASVKKGQKYTLPANGFTVPEGKEFAGWKVGNEDGVKQAGDKIDISGDVTLTATWKSKPGTDEPGTQPDPNQPGITPEPNPNEPGEDDFYIPEFRIHKDYTPTYPVYAEVPKTEKVEKVEEVPVSLETHKAYIAGYEDNTLRAEGNITRAEAAAMVTRLAGLDLSDNSMPAFKDMQKNAWYFRYINAAVKANMLDADNGMMRPNDKITRAEFAKMLAAIDKENSSVSKFEDIKGHRYEKEINKIYGNNRIEGYEDGSFRPDANLTRAESAAFLNRMFNRIADKEAYAGLEEKLARFKDFDSSKWYYDEMVEATNSHELTRRGTASDKYGRVYEKWTRILPSDVK